MRSASFPNRIARLTDRPIPTGWQEPDVSIEIAEGQMGFSGRTMQRIEGVLRQHAPRCIQPDETPEEAHRYAGKAELAAYLLAEFFPTQEP